jgi:hypothetical protein
LMSFLGSSASRNNSWLIIKSAVTSSTCQIPVRVSKIKPAFCHS